MPEAREINKTEIAFSVSYRDLVWDFAEGNLRRYANEKYTNNRVVYGNDIVIVPAE